MRSLRCSPACSSKTDVGAAPGNGNGSGGMGSSGTGAGTSGASATAGNGGTADNGTYTCAPGIPSRPLTEAEVTRFLSLSQKTPAGTPAEIAETTLLAFLVSPSFLLIPELTTAPDPSGEGIALSSYEVAARLSFLLWGSVPDDALNAAADANMLTTKDQILAQAQRMIVVRDKTGPLVASFDRDWVQMNNANAHWWKIDHDPTKYPLYTATSKASFQAELDAFFQDVVERGAALRLTTTRLPATAWIRTSGSARGLGRGLQRNEGHADVAVHHQRPFGARNFQQVGTWAVVVCQFRVTSIGTYCNRHATVPRVAARWRESERLEANGVKLT